MELPIDDEIVKKVEELAKNEIQPTFDQYPMFEWITGIPIMENMAEGEDKDLNE